MASLPSLVIVGASGHGLSVCDAAQKAGRHVVGFLDGRKIAGTCHGGVRVLGPEDQLSALVAADESLECVVAIGDNSVREACVRRLEDLCPVVRFATVIHPWSCIAHEVEVGSGTVILAGVILNVGVRIGRHCLLNTGSQLDHESELGDYASFAPRAATGGNVVIGRCSAVCIGATIIHGVKIGGNTVIGAGAVVLKDVPANAVAYGSPARVIRSRAPADRYL